MKTRAQQGFTLVEYLIAMAVSLLLIGAATLTYLNSKGVFQVEKSLTRIQDNGRFAVETLARDIRLAGFGACAGLSAATNTINTPAAFLYAFTQGLQGFEASGTGWLPALDTSITNGAPSAPLAGSDIVTVRRPEGASFALSAPWMATTASPPHADPAAVAGAGIQQGHFVLMGDCSATAIFQVANTDAQITGLLQHGTAGTPGNSTASLPRTFGGDALAMRVVTATYYVAPSQVSAGNNSLWLRLGSDPPAELAEGVDNMQILYGEDTDGDLTANRYVTADQVASMQNVVSLRVSVLMRTLEDNVATAPQSYTFNGAIVTPNDRRLRTVLTTVINIRNRTP